MHAAGVVKGRLIIEHRAANCLQIIERLVVRPFVLKRPKESLGHRVVVAVNGGTLFDLSAFRINKIIDSTTQETTR